MYLAPSQRRTMSERLDALIGFFSPRWAAERAAWRAAERLTYRAARSTRTDRGGGTPALGGSADYHLEAGYEREKMLTRARQLERDNAIASGILDRAVDNVIGTGMVLQARTSNPKWNARAEALFAEWAQACEVRGLDDFGELQRAVYRSFLRDGDVATVKLGNGLLQTVEGDLIASPNASQLSNRMVDGVELDAAGRPVRFWLIDESSMETRNNAGRAALQGTIAKDAQDVLFLARRKRLGQTRGEPAFAQSAWLFDQIDGHIEAVVTAARMAACFGVLVRRPGGFAGVPTSPSSDSTIERKDFRLEPGMVKQLEADEEVTTLSPAQPTQNFPDFLATIGRLLGLPFGLPLELVFLDFSKTNYSSARASLLQAYRKFRVDQFRFIAHWLAPIYRWKVAEWIADGKLDPLEDALTHTWIPPGWQWIDPKAEADGHALALDLGLTTVAEIVEATGRDSAELFAARSREIKAMREAGLPDVRSVGTRDPIPPKPAKDPARKAGLRLENARLAAELEILREQLAKRDAAPAGSA